MGDRVGNREGTDGNRDGMTERQGAGMEDREKNNGNNINKMQ